VRYFIHVITANERIRDPEGAEFVNLATAREEACQSARDLMADELRAGRPLPLAWRVQITNAEERVVFSLKFESLVLNDRGGSAAPSLPPRPKQRIWRSLSARERRSPERGKAMPKSDMASMS
jgi:hypothetical protein